MNIFILSGAGLSAESGLATFRGKDGLWMGQPVNDVASLEGFRNDSFSAHIFYNERRWDVLNVVPNAAHYALAELENMPGVELFHVTQNIDDLCERAGAKHTVHMHGEILKCRCLMCAKIFEWLDGTSNVTPCPVCGFTSEWGGIRPHVVWFGEMPFYMDRIERQLKACDLFVAIGTSGKVYPAARFVKKAKREGVKTLLINKEAPDNHSLFDCMRTGPASQLVPEWVAELRASLTV